MILGTRRRIAALTTGLLSFVPRAHAEAPPPRAWIEEMKASERGPFLRLRWFCKDGAVLPPQSGACASHGGGFSQDATASTNGHTVSGTASLQRQFGEHLNVQLGYTRLHQNYNVAAISTTPDTNREFVSISYQFSRALGR